ncbi:MAG: ABC transporter ATP-binding protein [Pseudonocardiales bacterium]|nr:MAG: ABC transporter ATP-binding protein [Pseudonocardiales bacterium]
MLLEIADLQVHYGKIEAIKGLSLQVDEGEIVTLIGSNGAGKTTTLKTISGLRRPTAGSIVFDGQDITKLAGHRRVQLGLCQAPEGRGIFPGMTVLENLEMGAYIRGKPPAADLDRAFSLFPRLAERRRQQGGTLSGGEQQMLAIGRALMAHPKLLLLDEPSMGLAPLIVTQIFAILREINNSGTTILLVEQNASSALQLSDRAYLLETGRVVMSGAAHDLLYEPAVRDAYLGAAPQPEERTDTS